MNEQRGFWSMWARPILESIGIAILLLALALLIGCAKHEERRNDINFAVDTPAGPIKGTVTEREVTDAQLSMDVGKAGDLLGTAASVAGTFFPWIGVAGLGIAALLKHRQAKRTEDERDVAQETVKRTATAIDTFAKDTDNDAPANRLKALLSQEMDKPHKMLVRQVKP